MKLISFTEQELGVGVGVEGGIEEGLVHDTPQLEIEMLNELAKRRDKNVLETRVLDERVLNGANLNGSSLNGSSLNGGMESSKVKPQPTINEIALAQKTSTTASGKKRITPVLVGSSVNIYLI